MALLKIIGTILLVGVSRIECGIVAPAIAPAYSYRQVAPPAILPFAASVSTFTRGLPIYAAPYAAGVLPPPVYPNVYPPPPFAGLAFAAPAIASPAFAPGIPGPAFTSGFAGPAIAPAYPGAPSFPGPLAYPGPVAPAALAPSPYVPAPLAAPSPLLPSPFGLPAARSLHAVAPGISPGLPAPFIG